jgi:hypothetical protein
MADAHPSGALGQLGASASPTHEAPARYTDCLTVRQISDACRAARPISTAASSLIELINALTLEYQ